MEKVPVEIQLRTISMEMWTGLEHQWNYKNRKNNDKEIHEHLKECAEILSNVDIRIQYIKYWIIEMGIESQV